MIHQSRGRAGQRALPSSVIEKALTYVGEELPGFTVSLANEILAREAGIIISTPPLRKYMRKAGMETRTYRTSGPHRKKRPRKPFFGEMLHCDGSFHRWRGPDYAEWCLLAARDDATGLVMARCAEDRVRQRHARALKRMDRNPWSTCFTLL